jgi:hypothetical protein
MCYADRDGDCDHPLCPQLRDNEPHKSGRHCPLDTDENLEWLDPGAAEIELRKDPRHLLEIEKIRMGTTSALVEDKNQVYSYLKEEWVDQNDLHQWIHQFGRGLSKGAVRELEKLFERKDDA